MTTFDWSLVEGAGRRCASIFWLYTWGKVTNKFFWMWVKPCTCQAPLLNMPAPGACSIAVPFVCIKLCVHVCECAHNNSIRTISALQLLNMNNGEIINWLAAKKKTLVQLLTCALWRAKFSGLYQQKLLYRTYLSSFQVSIACWTDFAWPLQIWIFSTTDTLFFSYVTQQLVSCSTSRWAHRIKQTGVWVEFRQKRCSSFDLLWKSATFW